VGESDFLAYESKFDLVDQPTSDSLMSGSKSGLSCNSVLRIDFPASVACLSESTFDSLSERPKL
jgi:hypothetical protein